MTSVTPHRRPAPDSDRDHSHRFEAIDMTPLSRTILARLGKTYLVVNGAVFLGSFLVTVVSHYL